MIYNGSLLIGSHNDIFNPTDAPHSVDFLHIRPNYIANFRSHEDQRPGHGRRTVNL